MHPTSHPTSVDPAAFGRAMTLAEKTTHKGGWDQPAQLWIVFRHTGNPDELVARPAPMTLDSPVAARMHAAAEQLRIAVELDSPHVAVLADPRFVGIGVVMEVWGNDQLSPGERAGRHLADIPGSWEARVAAAVDVDGNQHMVTRRRGYDPVAEHIPPGDDYRRTGGVFDALVAFVDVLGPLRFKTPT